MGDRRTNDAAALVLDYAVFLTRTRGITQALEYLDEHGGDRVLLWRMLGDIGLSRHADRRVTVRVAVDQAHE